MKNLKINIVGAGATGLMAAYYLNKEGYQITIIDAIKNPLKTNKKDELEGSLTWNSSDGRSLSFDETKRPTFKSMFFVKKDLEKSEEKWIKKIKTIDGNEVLKNELNVFFEKLNKKGVAAWREIIKDNPELAKDTLKNTDSCVRLFCDTTQKDEIERQINLHNKESELLSKDEIKERFPKIATDNLRIGVETAGFLINSKTFYKNLISFLEKKGVEFLWEKEIKKPLDLKGGELAFYCTPQVSYLNDLDLKEKINFIGGVFFKTKNLNNLKEGLKIHDKEALLTVIPDNENNLWINGGFGYMGENPTKVDSKPLEDFIKRIGSKYFPENFKNKHESYIGFRPSTVDGKSIIKFLDSNKTQVFIGGTNGGGMLQAPLLAKTALNIANQFELSSKIENFPKISPIEKQFSIGK